MNDSFNVIDLINEETLRKQNLLNMTYTLVEYNFSDGENSVEAREYSTEKEFPSVVLWATIDGFLFFAIITGNVLTISAIGLNRRISRVVSNQFILSLAISDLFVGLVLPYHMMFYIRPDFGRVRNLCLARLALVSLACIASVLNIIGIAVDRFVAVIYPLHYNKLMTKRLARILVVCNWAAAFAVATAPVYWNKWFEISQKPSDFKCELGYVVDKFYVTIIYVPTFILLFTIMCGFYVKIIGEARKHAKRLRQSNQSKTDSPGTWKSIQVLMLVMGSFTISYMPFIILVILNSLFRYTSDTTSVVYKITNSLAMANSAVNPLIYAWKNQEFKKTFYKIIRCVTVNGASSEEELSEFRSRVKSLEKAKTNNSLIHQNHRTSKNLDSNRIRMDSAVII